MIVVASGADIDWGLVAAIGVPATLAIIGLVVFGIKALIHKTVSPMKVQLNKVEGRMTLVETNYVSLLEAIQKLPEQLDAKIKAREELFNLELKHIKGDLDKKQDRI
jgi:hypothetical protein